MPSRTTTVATVCAALCLAYPLRVVGQSRTFPPSPVGCTDRPPSQTGFTIGGRVASCAALEAVGGCTHSTYGARITATCCVTCVGPFGPTSQHPSAAPSFRPTHGPTCQGCGTSPPSASPTHAPTPHRDVCRQANQIVGRTTYRQAMCQGYMCNSTFPAITTIEQCAAVAAALGTPDTFPEYLNDATRPRGCYFKTSNFYIPQIGHHNTSLWFNVASSTSQTTADPVRILLCGATAPPPPTVPGPTMQPTPDPCFDRAPGHTGYTVGGIPASCTRLNQINGCNHATHGLGISRVCCLTCTNHTGGTHYPTMAPTLQPTRYPTSLPGSPTRAPTTAPTFGPTPHSDVCRSTTQNSYDNAGRLVTTRQALCQGYTCNSTFPAATDINQCSALAQLLGLPDTLAEYTVSTTVPAGCYFKFSNYYNSAIGHHNTSLWFNTGAGHSNVDNDRVAVCGALPPGPSVPTTAVPSTQPTAAPTMGPTAVPTVSPSARPTMSPSARPTMSPSARPTVDPTARPTMSPSARPSIAPTARPTRFPTLRPSFFPTRAPTGGDTGASSGTSSSEMGMESMVIILAIVVVVLIVVVAALMHTKKKKENTDAARNQAAFSNPLYSDADEAKANPAYDQGDANGGYMDVNPDDV